MVVRRQLESNVVPGVEGVAAFQQLAIVVGRCLVDHRLVETHLTAIGGDHEVAIGANLQIMHLGWVECELNGCGVGAGGYDEIIFQLAALVAITNQVHAGIDVPLFHPGVIRHVSAPLSGIVANEVIALAREFLRACHRGAAVRAN